MTSRNFFVLLMLMLPALPGECCHNLYLVYYATVRGETGHLGIAIDNYRIEVVEKIDRGNPGYSFDTIRTGALTYYDLWPRQDYFDKKLIKADKEARYYKLPLASWENEITISSLIHRGVPHKKGYPVDGLLEIATSPYQDRLVAAFIDSIMDSGRPFNAITYNCADFAEQVIEFVLKKNIRAKEFVWAGRSTTPNKLFKRAAGMEGTKVIKDPGRLVNRIFLVERILKREIFKINSKSK